MTLRWSSSFISLTASTIVLAVLVLTVPAQAITYGTIDTQHTNVGSILADFPGFGWIQWCSGTLVSQRVFLTAGHCTDGLRAFNIPADKLRVSFSLNIFEKNAKWLEVASYMNHPNYNWGPTSDPNDLGIVVLRKPVRNLAPATLPPSGYLDSLEDAGLLAGVKFAVVGYGSDQNGETDGFRKIAFSEFLSLHDAWLYMMQNVHTGDSGTCHGDSGGPTFHNDGTVEYLVAVTSWGDAPCVATGINYRVDTSSSLAFINQAVAQNN